MLNNCSPKTVNIDIFRLQKDLDSSSNWEISKLNAYFDNLFPMAKQYVLHLLIKGKHPNELKENNDLAFKRE